MHKRQDRWFLPEVPHTTVSWRDSADGWLRLTVALDEAQRIEEDPRSSALDPETAARRTWSPGRPCASPEEAEPRSINTTVRRLTSVATEGVAADANPHEDTRGMEPVNVAAYRYALPDGFPPHIDISRTRDGVLFDIPLDRHRGTGATRIYGLGEKTGALDKRGRTWVMWNSDEPTHSPEKSALYQSLAVAYLWTPVGTVTLFVDSMATIWFDAAEAEPDRLLIEVYDDRFDLYLRRDTDLPAAVERYTELTGRIPLPPEWALGFQQCRYSYFPEARVLEVAERFRQERIPCDVIYLDIHYMDGYRVFTWDRRRFPDPARMTATLRKAGFRAVTIVDPGVKRDVDYPVFASGVDQDLFLRRPDGALYTGEVWPGEAVFPDFSRAAARSWWAEQHHTILDEGVDGIWNDMNEPADFTGDLNLRVDFTVPDELIAHNEGRPCSFGRVHNEYANGMNRATREAFARYRPDERGFVLTRAGAAGVQRYAAIWTGDNHSWWEHLAMMVPMFCNIGLSGAAFVGGDAGGFQLNADAELYSRWIAAAAFTPFFRAHSVLDSRDHEPWSFGPEVLAVARRFIGLRYRLLPYIYTLFEEATRNGAPVMRPLIWEFPDDPRVVNRADSFMLGPALLVAPVREPGVQERSVYLPAGTWYDFWTGERIDVDRGADGSGRSVVADAPTDRIPLYVRGGAIIPYESERQHTGEAGDGLLRLLVAPAPARTSASARTPAALAAAGGEQAPRATGVIYGDAGEGFGYRSGRFWRGSFSWSDGELHVQVEHGTGAEEVRWHRVLPVVLDGRARDLKRRDDNIPDSVLDYDRDPGTEPFNLPLGP